MFACACALISFVPTAKAQTDGDIVTIKTQSGNNYLAVNDAGTAIQNRTAPNEYCYWRRVTVSDKTYTFQSIISGLYLTINTNSLSLKEDLQDITWNSNKLSVTSGKNTYYIRYNKDNWTTTNKNNQATSLTITKVNYNLTLVSPTQENVTVDLIKTIRLSADATIGSVNENNISLTNATIDNIRVENNQLVITTKAPYADGD